MMSVSLVDENFFTAVCAVEMWLMLAILSVCYVRWKDEGNTRIQGEAFQVTSRTGLSFPRQREL